MLLINSEHQGLDHSLKFTVHFHIGHLVWSWPDAYEGRQAGRGHCSQFTCGGWKLREAKGVKREQQQA